MSAIIIPIAILGWACGALVNYLADVLPHYRSLKRPLCLHCGERFPLVNYLFWPRECPTCTGRRSLRVWIVEALGIACAVWLWLSPPAGLGFTAGLLLLVYFGVVAVIDIEHKLILHPVSIAGAALAFAVGWWLHGLASTLIGGAFGFLLMLALFWLGIQFVKLMRKLRGQEFVEDALGFGDVNLSGVLGLLLGFPGILEGLVVGVFLGALFSLGYIIVMAALKKYSFLTALPYGPFLISGAVYLLFIK